MPTCPQVARNLPKLSPALVLIPSKSVNCQASAAEGKKKLLLV